MSRCSSPCFPMGTSHFLPQLSERESGEIVSRHHELISYSSFFASLTLALAVQCFGIRARLACPVCPSTRSDRRGSTNLTAALTMEVTTQHVKRIDQLGTTNIGRRSIPTDSMSLTPPRSPLIVIHLQTCNTQGSLQQARVRVLESR